MAIVRMDTSNLSKYLDDYIVDGEFLRYGSDFRKKISQKFNGELDQLECFESTVFVREELAKFDKGFNRYTTLEDVENLRQKLWDKIHYSCLMFSLNYPVKDFARGLQEMFQIKILYYVITITNRDLPVDEFNSHVIMSNLNHSPNLLGEQMRIRRSLNDAYYYLKRWSVIFEKDHYPQMLYNKYRNQVVLMAKEAGIDTRTEQEKRKESIVKAKDKTVEIFLKILGFILVALIMSLIFNGWEGTFG